MMFVPGPCLEAQEDSVLLHIDSLVRSRWFFHLARSCEDGVTLAQIAKDFGVREMTLHKRIRQAEIDDGTRPGKTREDSMELRELRRRNRLLEQENEVLHRAANYLSQATLPGKGSTRSWASSPLTTSPSPCPCGS